MPPTKKILFPVDFSEQSSGAARYVRSLANECGAEVTLFHCVNPVDYLAGSEEMASYGWETFFQATKERVKRQLDGFERELFPDGSTPRVLCEGEPGRRIASYAQANDIDLIMMPSHGLGPFRRFLIGSVTAKVLHDAHCPVWTGVHMESAPPRQVMEWKNILCAVDLGAQSDTALRWAADFAKHTGGSLRILHAYPIVEARPDKYLDAEFEAAIAKQAREEIGYLQKRVGTNVPVILRGGPVERVVKDVGMNEGADLIVIGRNSAAAFMERLRAHAYTLIRNSPCPVVSV